MATACLASAQPASPPEPARADSAAISSATGAVQVPGYWRLNIGDAVVTALYDGPIQLPLSVLRGLRDAQARQLLAASHVPLTAQGVQTAVNAFLIERGGRRILIDAGAAQCFGPGLGRVVENLKAAGVEPARIDAVVVTHLHPDHVCGATAADGTRAFANAELVAPRSDADHWLSEAVAAKAPKEVQGMFKAARDAVAPYRTAGKFRTFEDGAQVLPGLTALGTHGHTPGHTSFWLNTGSGPRMLVWGDIVHSHSVQFQRPEVTLEFDTDPKEARATRRDLLKRLAGTQDWVAGAHLPFPGIGHVGAAHEGYRWIPAEYGPLSRP